MELTGSIINAENPSIGPQSVGHELTHKAKIFGGDVISNHSNIKVVAEGEGKYLGPDGGIAATQDILSSGKAFDSPPAPTS